MSKKPKKVEGHPASKIFFGLIGALTDFSGLTRIIDSIKLRRETDKAIKENEKYFKQFPEYTSWLLEYEALMKRRPKCKTDLHKLP